MKLSPLLDHNSDIRLAPHVSHFVINDELFFLKCDNTLYKIDGRFALEIYRRLFRTLHDPKKVSEILNCLSDFQERDVMNLLAELYKLNLIIKVNTQHNILNRRISKSPNFARMHPDNLFASRLVGSPILLIGEGNLANKLFRYLRKTGLQVTRTLPMLIDSPSSSGKSINKDSATDGQLKGKLERALTSGTDYDLVVVSADYPNIVLFETANEICMEKNLPWIRASFDDVFGYLGPLVTPKKSSCYECCQLRLANNSPYYEDVLWEYAKYIPKTPVSISDCFADILTALCAEEVVRYLTAYEKSQTRDNLVVLDTRDMSLTKHRIFAHPDCEYRKLHPALQHKKASVSSDSSPLHSDKLLQLLRELIDSKTGIIFKEEKLYDPNLLGIKAHHFFEASCSYPIRVGEHTPIDEEMDDDRVFCSGSGLTPNEAEMHALMESIERYSNMSVDESQLRWETYNNLHKKAINPVDLVLYPDEQYDTNGFACSRFSSDSLIPWIEGYDLFSGGNVLVPADFVYYPPLREKPLVLESSNGAAAHTNIVQAILNGLFEIIERDAIQIMWLNKLSMPIIEVSNLPFSFNEAISLINNFGMQVKLVDLTNDNNIPAVMAVAYNTSKYPAMVLGSAAHIEPHKAIQKALFEVELLLMNFLEFRQRRKVTREYIATPFDHCIYYADPKMCKYWDFMIRSKTMSSLSIGREIIGTETKDNYILLMKLVKTLHDMNHRVIYVDITPPDIRRLGLKAVKVLITGFQPIFFKEGYARYSQRLLTVPSRLGYNKRSYDISKLNLAPHPVG
jgi:ribosomal protein S12 methylthiotransferase accessory factor